MTFDLAINWIISWGRDIRHSAEVRTSGRWGAMVRQMEHVTEEDYQSQFDYGSYSDQLDDKSMFNHNWWAAQDAPKMRW